MLKSQPLDTFSLESVSSKLDATGGVAEDEAPNTLSDRGGRTSISESPKRRAHRQRMKAFLAATRPAT